MTDLDTLRWGDSQYLAFVPSAGEGPVQTTKQLLSAKWQRPVVWRVLVNIQVGGLIGDNANYLVIVKFAIGVGQTTITGVQRVYALTAPYTIASDIFDSFDIPAQDIQATCTLQQVTASAVTTQESVQLGIVVAPHAEPGAIAHMRDEIAGPNAAVAHPDRQGLPHWMPAGFNDGLLRYQHEETGVRPIGPGQPMPYGVHEDEYRRWLESQGYR